MQPLPPRLLRAVLARALPQSFRQSPPVFSALTPFTSRNYHRHVSLLQAEQSTLSGASAQSTTDSSTSCNSESSRLSSSSSSLSSPRSASVAASFARLGDANNELHPLIAASLASYGYIQPTDIQQRAFLPIAQQRDVVLACETGAGKTLAYLLPTLSALLRSLESEAAQAADSEYVPARRRVTPRLIIVSINRELCAQIHAVVQMLLQPTQSHTSHSTPTPNCTLLAGTALLPTTAPTDLLITTPSCLYHNLTHTPTLLSHTTHLIFDEADLLLSSSAAPSAFLNSLRSLRSPTGKPALVFVAATINAIGEKSVNALLKSRFPKMEWINSSLFHSNRSQVSVQWMQVSSDDERRQQLMRVLTEERTEGKRGEERRVLLFCNTVERAQSLYGWLLKQGTLQPAARPSPSSTAAEVDPYQRLTRPDGQRLLVGRFHKHVPIHERFSLLNHFHPNTTAESTAVSQPPLSSARPVVRVLVCTNLAARGVDFVGVECVVQYDMALSTVEHLHRAGRTGRMQRHTVQQPMKGRVVCLWDERSDGLLVGEIRKGEQQQDEEEAGEEGSTALLGGFSRRRSLRRKYKKVIRESIEARKESMQLTAGDDNIGGEGAELVEPQQH